MVYWSAGKRVLPTMVRRTDTQEPSSGSQKDKRAVGRKAGTDKSQAPQLCGWASTPALAYDDDNDIISWMRRAKNGDNRQDNRNGSLCEEQFRHVFDLCTAIEDKQMFELQILNCDRHPRNCHNGPQATSVATATTSAMSTVDGTSPELDKDENCQSDDKRASVVRGGNRSAASMREEGTLSREVPESSRVQGKNNAVKDGHPCNDSNDDGAKVKGLGAKCKADAAFLDDARVPSSKVTGDGRKQEGRASSQKNDCELEENQGQHESVTRLRYSCAEESTFSEQSTYKRGSGYNNGDMDHQTADYGLSRTSASVYPASRHHQAVGIARQKLQQQQVVGDATWSLEPRVMVLRKIMIQDSPPDVHSRDPEQPILHPRVPRSRSLEKHDPQSRGPVKAETAAGHHSSSADSLSRQLGDGLTSEGADDAAVTSPTGRTSAASYPLPSCIRSANENERSQILDLYCDGISRIGYCYHNALHQMTSLPMTDLLPAVERKIYRTRSTQREVTIDNNNIFHLQNDRWHQHRQQQQQQEWRQQESRTTVDEGSQGYKKMAARSTYSPVSVNDTGQARALRRAESKTSVTKPRRPLSVWTFSLVIIGLCVLFLLGFCLGFYVRESQSQITNIEFSKCDGVLQDDSEQSKLAALHEDIMYRIRGEHVLKFSQEFSYQDPVSDSLFEHRLEQHVHQVLEQLTLDDLHVEEHEVMVTYCDPGQPNHLQVFHKGNDTVLASIRLTNAGDDTHTLASQTITENWKYPFVAFSPAGIAEGDLLYGHYGSESDLLVLQAKGVVLKNRIILLRAGRLSLAEKVQNVADEGAVGVIVYWDPADASDNPDTPSNISYIPYAAAAIYTTDSSHLLVPRIPVQTISMETATLLFKVLSQEEGSVVAPTTWSGRLQVTYTIGTKYNNGNISLRMTTFNKERQVTVKNIVANIHGTSEKDRYVVIGAPRASLLGASQDAVISTNLLLQLANALNTAYSLKKWKPKRGIRIVSWGGADLANIGMLQHIVKHHHLLSWRAVAYFDIRSLMVGTDIITAQVPPGLFQVINEVTLMVPDPNDADHTIQSSWQEMLSDNQVDARSSAVPLASYHGDHSAWPFLHVVGVPTISLQYRDMNNFVNGLTVPVYSQVDGEHHFKYHIAVMRVMVQILVSMVDDQIIPYSLSGAVSELSAILWQTSEFLNECSQSMHDLEDSLNLCSELEATTKVFEDFIEIYLKKKDLLSLRMVNDVKMMFDKLFIIYRKGIPRHILYPLDERNIMEEVLDLCSAGGIADIWEKTHEFADSTKTVLLQALLALRAAN